MVLEQDFVRVQEWLQVNEDSGKIHADPYRSIILPVLARKKGGVRASWGQGIKGVTPAPMGTSMTGQDWPGRSRQQCGGLFQSGIP